MKIFPAIDIRDKKVVRLTQGDYDRMTVYSENPLDIAKKFQDEGAKNMHIVDLDGALDGKLVNFKTIEAVVSQADMFVEVGGGIRDEDKIKQYIDAGVGRVILGTIAIENFDFVERMTQKYDEKIAVGVDAKDEYVAINGWKTISNVNSYDFCVRLRDSGVKTVIYTDISKDGAMKGTNLTAYQKLNEILGLNIVVSGGITYLSEIKSLAEMKVYGAILGKALYTGAIDLKDALKCAEE